MQTKTSWKCDRCAAEAESVKMGVPDGWSALMVGGTTFFPHQGHYCSNCTGEVVTLLGVELRAVPEQPVRE